MVRKRVIFGLLHDGEYFCISRNFRLQKVGDATWLKDNFGFDALSSFVDELAFIYVGVDKPTIQFWSDIALICERCFVPVSVGGGIRTIDDATEAISRGADRLILNYLFVRESDLVKQMALKFGRQALIGSLDLIRMESLSCNIYGLRRDKEMPGSADLLPLHSIKSEWVGELLIRSVDKDGTGQGLDLEMLDSFSCLDIPLIIAGGSGNGNHLKEALRHEQVAAVLTSNLFNFIGYGLSEARLELLRCGLNLAKREPLSDMIIRKTEADG